MIASSCEGQLKERTEKLTHMWGKPDRSEDNDGGPVQRDPGATCSRYEWRMPHVLCTLVYQTAPFFPVEAQLGKPKK